MTYKKEKVNMKQYKDIPYTMVAHTSLVTEFNMMLKAGGLKKLVENCHDEDLVHITVFADKSKGTEFQISKFEG